MNQFGYPEIISVATACVLFLQFAILPYNKTTKRFGLLAAAFLLVGVVSGFPIAGLIAFLVSLGIAAVVHQVDYINGRHEHS